MAKFYMDLTLFGDGGAGAGAAPAAGPAGESAGEAAVNTAVQPGTLPDGTKVDNRLAARMEAQAERRRKRGEEPKPAEMRAEEPQQTQPQQAEAPAEQPAMSLDDEWAEAKKGKFREQYGRDVQAAVMDRVKNLKAASDTLEMLTPALNALAKQRGINEGDWQGLAQNVMDDDATWEEAAEEAGMSVEAFKIHEQLRQENERLKAREQQEQQDIIMRNHFRNLANQAEEMKQLFPDFNLQREMENQTFRRLVAPNSGLSVKDAYFAVHHSELEPQLMAYGIQHAQQQISQTLQANRMRPVEGAMQSGQPADITVNPAHMSKEERKRLIERARRGEKIVF